MISHEIFHYGKFQLGMAWTNEINVFILEIQICQSK